MMLRGLIVGMGALLVSGAVLADDWRNWPLGERMKLSVGAYAADINTEATVSEIGGLKGTPVDFEDDLGLDDSQTAAFVSLNLRMFKRHALAFNYYKLDRDASATTTDPIAFNGVIFPSDVDVDTTFDLSVYEMSYSYSLIFDPRKNLYLGFGISAQDLTFEIASSDFPALSTEENFIAPLPTVNLGFDYAFSDRWMIGAKLGYMDADVTFGDDEFDAEVLTADAGLRWRPIGNTTVGLSYSVFQLDGNYTDGEIYADMDLDYKGPRVSLDLFF